jgi:hypothetical protein
MMRFVVFMGVKLGLSQGRKESDEGPHEGGSERRIEMCKGEFTICFFPLDEIRFINRCG